MSLSVAGPSPGLAASEGCNSHAGARTFTQACWEIQKNSKNSTNFRKKKKEKKLKGKVLGTHTHSRTHAHTATHTARVGMTHELQAKSNMFSAERRETQLSEMKAEAAGVWRVEHQ